MFIFHLIFLLHISAVRHPEGPVSVPVRHILLVCSTPGASKTLHAETGSCYDRNVMDVCTQATTGRENTVFDE